MTDSDKVKLLPCPCGETAFVAMVNDARQVWCRRDMCWKGPLRSTKAEAVAAWNNSTIPTRPPVVTDEVVERYELVSIIRERRNRDFDGECHLTTAEADRIITFFASMPAVVSGGQSEREALVAELAEVTDVAKGCAKREQQYFADRKELLLALKRSRIALNLVPTNDKRFDPANAAAIKKVTDIIDEALRAAQPGIKP